MDGLESLEPVKTVSRATFEAECGRHIGAKLVKRLLKLGVSKVPDPEQFRPGDVILSRSVDGGGKLSKSFVEKYQRTISRFSDHDAVWSHAMLYVGHFHAVESQALFKLKKPFVYLSGTRVASLVEYTSNYNILICRPKSLRDYPLLEMNISRYALLDQAVNRRKYSYKRVIDMFRKNPSVPRTPDFATAIICSELALESLAIAGDILVEEYNNLEGNDGGFFFPADFHKSEKFEKLPVSMIPFDANAH